uniref:Regulator of chromosome condensation (RCC1)-like protein n=1 Tax=Anisakis simplex TaxID=6269 RepID=A0A0M3K994_ANISI
LDEVLVEFIARHHYEMHYCDYLATRLKYERLKLCTMVVRNALRLMNSSNAATTTTTTAMDRSSDIQAIIKLAFSAQMDIGNIIRIFNEYDAGDALLPTVLERCATNKSDECRHSIVELYISKLRKNESERDNIERDLRTFLAEHTDISDGIELLLRNGLWSCVAIMVSRSATQHSESVANFLCSDGLEWPVDKVSHLVRTLNGISWNDLSPNAEQLLIRMINYLPHLRSLSHIVSFARIGEGQMNRFHQTGAALYALCTLRLLDATPSFDYTSLPSNLPLSCGSNCITLISEDESVIFIGEFSAGSMKMKDAERNKIVANRYALPRQINVPERVCSVSAGTEHVLCLTTYGNLYSFGKNRFGECGVGHKREVSEASRVRGSFEGIRSICSGHYHSALIDSKGRVFTWGWAIHGQLGHETRDRFEDITVPRLVETIDEEIKAVCCGYAHTIFLSERGIVYGCGNSIYGQLGCGEDVKKRFVYIYLYRPSMIDIPEKVKLISSKYFHGIAVSESQKIYQWGISPLSLKMKAFLAKRVRTANREQQQQQQQQQEQSSSNIPSALLNDKSPDSNPLETSQSYLSVSRVEHMISDDIMAVDAGYSHSALITKSGLIYTWGKGLEMQLGHGNKKEQQEPHQLFEPSVVIWQRVSCGLDFTSAISSDGNVFVWGRNDKCQLGVQSLPAPHLTRKLIIKGPKGPRSIQITADSPCVAIPTRLSSVTALVPSGRALYIYHVFVKELLIGIRISETSSDDINDGNLIRFLQRLDADTISNISSELQRNAIVSAPAIFVHLLAGELQRAIELLVQMPIADKEIDALLRNGCDADETHGNIRVGGERQPSSLLAAIWDLTLKHPNFIEQWKAISTLTRTYPIGDLLLSDRKLSAEASVILATKPDMLNGLSATQKLRLLEKWQPETTLQPIEIAQNDLQACRMFLVECIYYFLRIVDNFFKNMGNRIRYWSCCGNVEKFNASSSSLNNEKRRICSKCSDAWRCAIKSKFSRYA